MKNKKTHGTQITIWASEYKYKTLNNVAKILYGENTLKNRKKAMLLINKWVRLNRITYTVIKSGIQFKPRNSFMV